MNHRPITSYGLVISFALVIAAGVVRPVLAEETAKQAPRLGVWGDTMGLDNSRAGVRVTRLDAGSPVLNMRLLSSEFTGPALHLLPYRDVITAVEGQRVTKVDELNDALSRAEVECRITIYNRTLRREAKYYVILR